MLPEMLALVNRTGAGTAGTGELERCAKTLKWLSEYHKQMHTSTEACLVQPRHLEDGKEVCCVPASGTAAEQRPALHSGDFARISAAAAEGMKNDNLSTAQARVLLHTMSGVPAPKS